MKKGEGQANRVTIYVHLHKYSIFPLCEPYTEKQNHPFLHEFLNICQEVIYPASQGFLFELLVQLMH